MICLDKAVKPTAHHRQESPSREALSCAPVQFYGPVAQLVEHRTFNAVVAGSSPARLTTIFNELVNFGILSETGI
jgi:hypothetical protein